MKLAVIISRYNSDVTDGLLKGCLQYLKQEKISIGDNDMFEAPGAFELPIIAKKVATSGKYHGVICLGSVIKGETAHFDLISNAVSTGLMQLGMELTIPISFGVLTTYDRQQALARSGDNDNNKGVEAARSCHKAVLTLQKV